MTLESIEARLNRSNEMLEQFRLLLPNEQFDLVLELFDRLTDSQQMEISAQIVAMQLDNEDDE